MLIAEFKVSDYEEKLHPLGYYKNCIYKIKRIEAPSISNLKVYDYIFWDPLIKELMERSVDESVKYLFIANIDRGIRDFDVFGYWIKKKYPNVEEIFFEQNYSGGDSNNWHSAEDLFVYMNLKRLIVCTNQLYENGTIRDTKLMEQLIDNNDEINDDSVIEWDEDGPIYVNLDETLQNDGYVTKLFKFGDPRY